MVWKTTSQAFSRKIPVGTQEIHFLVSRGDLPSLTYLVWDNLFVRAGARNFRIRKPTRPEILEIRSRGQGDVGVLRAGIRAAIRMLRSWKQSTEDQEFRQELTRIIEVLQKDQKDL